MTEPPSIFILIASYRDPECQWTVRDLFDKSAKPERIRAGICWLGDPDKDSDCFDIETRPAQVDVVRFRPEEAQGSGWARAQAQGLLRDEDYALQIDSGMRFVKDWDERMLAVFAQCDSPRPLLTVYPPGYTPPNDLEPDPPPRVQCIKDFNPSGVLFCTAKTPPNGVQPTRPMATACVASSFIFGAADWMRAVAQDPYIYFNAEEHALAARLWTHGFDLFSPHETLIYHYDERKDPPRPWMGDANYSEQQKNTLLRLRQLLAPATLPERDRLDLGIYGLGSARTLADYEAFAGVSFAARSIAAYARSYPYVRTADAAGAVPADHHLEVSDKAALFIVDDEGLLFSAARGEIYHLNPAATYVWCALEAGASWDELVAGLSGFCAMTAGDAESTLANLVLHWRGQGVLRGNEADDEGQGPATAREEIPAFIDQGAMPFPAQATFRREQHYRVLDSCFRVRFGTAAHVDWLMSSLTHFEVASYQAPDHVITVYGEGDRHHIFQDGQLLHTDKRVSQLAPFLKHQLVRTALDHYDHILNLHAGVVARDGALIALPAQSGDGKSTLVAGLITRGYRYFSDELAPLARNTCEVIPVPLGICIKDTAFPTLQGPYPEVLQQPIHDRADGRRAIYLPPPTAAIAARDQTRQISHIVFPRYVPGANTLMKPIPRVEAFARAMEQCVSIPRPLTLDDAAVLVHWIEHVECFDLVSGSLEAMMDQIDGLLPSAEHFAD